MKQEVRLAQIKRELTRGLGETALSELHEWSKSNPHLGRLVIGVLEEVVKSRTVPDGAWKPLVSTGVTLVRQDPELLPAFLNATITTAEARQVAHGLVDTIQTYDEARYLIHACNRVAPEHQAGIGLDLYILLAAARRRPYRMNTLLDAIVDEFGKDRGLACPLGYGNLLLLACMWMRAIPLNEPTHPQGTTLDLVRGLIARGVDPMFACWKEHAEQGKQTRTTHYTSVLGAVCAAMDQDQQVSEGLEALLTCGARWDGLDQGNNPGARAIRAHPAWRRDRLVRQVESTKYTEDMPRL